MNNLHGGDLDAIERLYGIPKAEIKNFSGNVNPLGPPTAVIDAIVKNAGTITGYPDVEYIGLRTSISRYTGAPVESIVCGNGSTELISQLIKTAAPRRAVVVSPAYSEYKRELELIGCDTVLFPLDEDAGFELDSERLKTALCGAELLIMCNPNNPTGTAVTRTQLMELLEYCQERSIRVMVDETYAEFADSDVTAVPLCAEYPNLFVVRGTSKFFAVPGLRLGYGICGDTELLERVNTKKDPWSVNILSAFAGEAMFNDIEYIERTKALIKDQREFFYRELEKNPYVKAYSSRANFILIRLVGSQKTSAEITSELLQKRLLVRDAASFPYLDESYLRFCVLEPQDNRRLMDELKKLLHC